MGELFSLKSSKVTAPLSRLAEYKQELALLVQISEGGQEATEARYYQAALEKTIPYLINVIKTTTTSFYASYDKPGLSVTQKLQLLQARRFSFS